MQPLQRVSGLCGSVATAIIGLGWPKLHVHWRLLCSARSSASAS